MKRIFLPYEWLAFILGTSVLMILCLNMLQIIQFNLSIKFILQALIILTIGIISIRTRKWIGILTLIVGVVLLIISFISYLQ
ncbi:hypothetical protein [Staphylococcus agnetis]|uniref:hypothetical protein n=1 Tax=Staphylococcus agnetis TaxID=985762 RepID=UPI0004E390B9|nr:hypothetical protein [Staphylococcus agnetis]KFE42153.1 hypothetical protein SAGN_04990 [Staphylococcus agnetis]NJH65768.1 hypothetical protein [Staphylococcus agnetis]NJH96556.1 hypothetical protein [Staphylococcus agnetis]PTH47621.1 hypothetical protein BU587_05895 [Staphylococcus agnetis]PTH74468.1 hypothetical protein BU581_00385 [Staphylococcus agnetis]